MKSPVRDIEHLSIAVVICTRDRPQALLETLDSIWRQTRLPLELVVIDDGRLADEVRERIARQCYEYGISWRYEPALKSGLTACRNQAARLARSEILQYLDDDVTCEPGFLAEVGRIMNDPLVAGVSATVVEPAFDSLTARLYQMGYRLAGWWRVRPRGRPRGAAPAALRDQSVVVPARWLSGAAMALRRDIVLANPFDETLREYALGEDREIGYRLAARHWLLESKRARVIHRRATAERTDSRRFGFMTSYNYLYVMRKTCHMGPGEWLLIGWSLFVLALMHMAWGLAGRRAHLAELRGMVDGVIAAFRSLRQSHRQLGDATQPVVGLTHRHGRRTRRVLFVTNRLEHGGAEWMLLSLIRHLPTFDIDPLVLCLKDAGPLAPECLARGVPVFEGLLKYKTDAAVLRRIGRLIAEQRINVVVAAHSGGDRMFWSTIAARLTDTPVVVWSHWFPRTKRRHFERANRALYRFVDAFVALGERHRRALIRHEQVPSGRIAVIPNAIELGRFLGAPGREEARRRLRLTRGQTAVALVANLRPEKRHDVFIEAARRLSARHPNMRFIIIGDGPARETVQAAAADSGLDHEALRIVGPRDDVPELWPGIDIACLCSEVECFSVTMLEAAAAGCPFIGPDAGCIPEFLEHDRTGLLIRPADVDELVAGIERLAADAGLRKRLAAAARERVIQSYGIERMARSFADLFFSLRQRGSMHSTASLKRMADPPAVPKGAVSAH